MPTISNLIIDYNLNIGEGKNPDVCKVSIRASTDLKPDHGLNIQMVIPLPNGTIQANPQDAQIQSLKQVRRLLGSLTRSVASKIP